MQILMRLSVLLTALFFAIGGLLAWRGTLDANTYIIITGIVGSIASIIGLIGLGNSRLTAGDIRNVEADLIKELADQVKAAKETDEKLASGREELNRLERERAEVELLVRQASLKVFMEERLRNLAREVDRRLDRDSVLTSLLSDYEETLRRVEELQGEVESSARADRINEILDSINAGRTRPSQPVYVTLLGQRIDIRPLMRASGRLLASLGQTMTR